MAQKFSEIIKSSTPTLVDFYAEWCGPCKTMKPILEDLKSKMGGKAKVITIDVDRNQHTAERFKVRSVPTLILFKNGEIVWRQAGVVQSSQLKSIINGHLG